MYNIISVDCDGNCPERSLFIDKETLRFVIEFVEELEKQELSLNEVQSLIRLMEAIRSMIGFMKFQDNERKNYDEILKSLFNRAVTMPPEIPEVREERDVSEVPETSPLHLSSSPPYDNNSPQEEDLEDLEDQEDEDDIVPVIDNSSRWNDWRETAKKIQNSSILKSVLKGFLYLLGITIVVFNVFILIALIQSADLPDKNPLCQPTASKGYHIRDWVDETSEKVRYQMWKFNQWLETRNNATVDSCPDCPACQTSPPCPPCPTFPKCPTCPRCPVVKKEAETCDLRSTTDIVSFQKGCIL